MKTMIQKAMLLVLLALPVSVAGQEKIDKIVKELESKGVEVSLIVKRNHESKKTYMRSRTLTFISKDSNYLNRLLKAFEEESEQADEAYMNRGEASVYPRITVINLRKGIDNTGSTKVSKLVFVKGKIRHTYTMKVRYREKADPVVTLNILYTDKSVPANKGGYSFFMDDLSLNNLETELGELEELGELGELGNLLDGLTENNESAKEEEPASDGVNVQQ